MTVPGPAAGAQPTRAGAKWRARPKRPAAATSPPGQAHGRCWRRARPRRPRSARHAATRRPGGQRRVGPADHAQLEHRETAHLLRATAQAAQPAAHCSDGHAQVRADPHAARPTQPPPGRWPITSRASARRGAHHDGSKMCVRWQERQRARSGRSRVVAPPSSRITRSRPWPYRASRPVPQDGQASRPPAKSAEAAVASAHNSTAGLPEHNGHDALPTPARPSVASRADHPDLRVAWVMLLRSGRRADQAGTRAARRNAW